MSKIRTLLGLMVLFGLGLWLSDYGQRNLQICTINWTDVRQTIDGFGGASFIWNSPLTPSLADFFFKPQGGIGLSIVRSGIMPDLSEAQAYCADSSIVNPPCTAVTVSSGPTMASGDLGLFQQAYARGVTQFMLSSWSPPGSMKSNGSYLSGGSFVGNSTNYTNYAAILAGAPAFLAANGLPAPIAISPQNEPDLSLGYPSATWTGQQFHDFIPYLYSALGSSVKIAMPEESGWRFSRGSTAMSDAAVAQDVGIIAGHGYSGSPGSAGLSNITNQHIWMTEVSSHSSKYTGTMSDALRLAQLIHNYLTQANANAWIWWYLSDTPTNGNGTDNSALTDSSGNIPKRAYMTGNWSKFVRPGWSRIGVSYSGPLLITAFKDPESHSFAIVAVNPSHFSVRQTFSLNGFSTNSVTPWITSAGLSLAPQNPVSVSEASFSYLLPGSSVATFSGAVPRAH